MPSRMLSRRRTADREEGFEDFVRSALAADDELPEAKAPFLEWNEAVPISLERELDFDRFPYQREWYSDEVADAEEVVIQKSTQIGESEHESRWATRRADVFGDTVLYIFPTADHVSEFGDERIEPMIEASEYLQRRIRPRWVKHKKLKRIGHGWLHLRGSNSKAGAQSVSAAAIVFDEYDLLDQGNLAHIERRITGAKQLGKTPKVRRLGTPTISGDGISAAFEHSDRRIWHVTCESCGLAQEVTWEENVRWRMPGSDEVLRPGADDFEDPKVIGEVWRQCKDCEAELDVRNGEWIATNPDSKVIGFHATRLIVPFTDLAQIVKASRSTKPLDIEAFENLDLGRPYEAAEASLTMEDLLRACSRGGPKAERYDGPNPRVMGVDVAGERDLNAAIYEQLPPEHEGVPNPRRALWIGTLKSFEDVVDMIHRFGPEVVVIDANPESRMAKAVRAEFAPGRVILCSYNWLNDSDSIKVHPGEKGTPLEGVPLKVTVNRTEAIDAMMDGVRQERSRPLADPPPGYFDQMRALKRKTELDKKGRVNRVYVTTGASGDDYAHAEVYVLVATEMLRTRLQAQSMQRERVLPDEEMGFQRVRLEGGDPSTYKAGLGE